MNSLCSDLHMCDCLLIKPIKQLMKTVLTPAHKFTKRFLLSALSFGIAALVFADPPEPEEGERWVLNQEYSDEFNGTSLDTDKWHDYFINWKGRSPAKFDPSSVSVSDGNMIIRNKKLANADGDYTIGGGAVQSNGISAYFGYYECSFKASRINMSTTFWMSNAKETTTNTRLSAQCNNNERYSQELDICESIGGAGNFSSKFRTQQNFNTHYRHQCNGAAEKFFSAGNNAVEGNGQTANANLAGGTEAWEDYHTYACYWIDAKTVDFYTDNNFAGRVNVNQDVVDNPFDRPMKINMVTETYNWAKPYPTDAELANNNINASYYDWIRSYYLTPVDQALAGNNPTVNIYNEQTYFSSAYEGTRGVSSHYEFVVLYKANEDRELHIIIKDLNGNLIKDTQYTALAGFGKSRYAVDLDASLNEGSYTVTLEIRTQNTVISSETKGLTIMDGVIGPNVLPSVSFQDLSDGQTLFEGANLGVTANASDSDGSIINVSLYLNDVLVRSVANAPFTWGSANANQTDNALFNLAEGEYTLRLLAEDNRGGTAEKTIRINVVPEGQISLSPINDAYLQGAAGTNFNTQDLRVENNNRVSYLMFDLSTLPSGVVANAKLQLSVGADAGNGNIKVYQVENNWQEGSVNGTNKPTKITGELAGTFTGSYALGTSYMIDLSSVDFTGNQVSFVLEMDAGGNDVSFASKEAGTATSPQLLLVVDQITSTRGLSYEAIQLYPNPASTEVNLSTSAEWRLYDLQGRMLEAGSGSKISLSNYSKGLYWVSIGSKQYKLIKE